MVMYTTLVIVLSIFNPNLALEIEKGSANSLPNMVVVFTVF